MSNWEYVKVSDFLEVREGKYKPTDPILTDLKRLDKIDFNGIIHLSDKPTKTDMIIVQPGDLVISGINVAKGAIAIWEGSRPIVATIHYSSYRFNQGKISLPFLKRFLKSPAFTIAIQEQVKGGIKTEIKPKHLLPLKIMIPNIDEQKRINDKFDSIDDELKCISTEITTQSIFLIKLRQSILQEAIEGNLTVEWRKANPVKKGDPNYDAEELLSRIKAEKQKLIAEGTVKKEKTLPSIRPEEVPFTLPEGWAWCRLGSVIKNPPRNGYSPKEVSYETNVRTLKLGATTWGKFDNSQFKHVDEDIPEDSIFWLKKNDILIQRSNSIDYVGVSAIYDGDDHQFIYPDLMMKIEIINPILIKYSYFMLSSPFTRTYYRRMAKGAQKSMPKIDQATVNQTLFVLPSLAEQYAIVTRVETLLAMVDKLETQLKERKVQVEALLQSVLREAFEEKTSKDIERKVMSLPSLQEREKNHFLKRKMLASYIINSSESDSNFGDTKFEKLLFLVEYHALKRNFGQEYRQKAAGPYDNQFTIPFFQQTIKSGWFYKQPVGKIHRILPGQNNTKSRTTYNYFSNEELKKIDSIIDTFHKFDFEIPEIVATLFAVWNNRIIRNQEISDELLKQDFLDWDTGKAKYVYPKDRVTPGLKWMRENSFIPTGWGKVIEAPVNGRSKGKL